MKKITDKQRAICINQLKSLKRRLAQERQQLKLKLK